MYALWCSHSVVLSICTVWNLERPLLHWLREPLTQLPHHNGRTAHLHGTLLIWAISTWIIHFLQCGKPSPIMEAVYHYIPLVSGGIGKGLLLGLPHEFSLDFYPSSLCHCQHWLRIEVRETASNGDSSILNTVTERKMRWVWVRIWDPADVGCCLKMLEGSNHISNC